MCQLWMKDYGVCIYKLTLQVDVTLLLIGQPLVVMVIHWRALIGSITAVSWPCCHAFWTSSGKDEIKTGLSAYFSPVVNMDLASKL